MSESAGQLIRKARQRARLSQPELARRAHVAQPVISAYESGHREPGIHMFTKLIEATGHELSFRITPAPGRLLGLPDTRLGRLLRQRRKAILAIAARRGARNVRVFGSVSRGDDTASSDIDLLVDLNEGVGLVTLAGLKRELTELLGTDVDVIPSAALKPTIRDEVHAGAVAL